MYPSIKVVDSFSFLFTCEKKYLARPHQKIPACSRRIIFAPTCADIAPTFPICFAADISLKKSFQVIVESKIR